MATGRGQVVSATGRGQEDLTDLEGLKPCPRGEDGRFFGIRDAFGEGRAELPALGIPVVTLGGIPEPGPEAVTRATAQAFDTDRFRRSTMSACGRDPHHDVRMRPDPPDPPGPGPST